MKIRFIPILIVLSLFGFYSQGQNFSRQISLANLSEFNPSKGSGYTFLNCYVSKLENSTINIQVILLNEGTDIPLNKEVFIGELKDSSYFPKYSNTEVLRTARRNLEFIIEPDGKVYIKILSQAAQTKPVYTLNLSSKYSQ